MSAEVTGLDYDIGYNVVLSDMDKAYMCIMYPRPAGEVSPKKEWTLEYALSKSGIAREDPEICDEILDIYQSGKASTPPTIDVDRVRYLFSQWCLDTHISRAQAAAKGNKRPIDDVSSSDEDYRFPTGAVVELEPVSICSTVMGGDTNVAKAAQPGKGGKCQNQDGSLLCSRDALTVQITAPGTANGSVPHPPRAVIDPAWLHRTSFNPLDIHRQDYEKVILWNVVDCPDPPSDPNATRVQPPATNYQLQRLMMAMAEWGKYASIRFERAENGAAPDLVVVFQSESELGVPITQADPLRSYTTDIRQIPPNDDGSVPQVAHDICFRAISPDAAIAAKPASAELARNRTRRDLDSRTLLHELGHFLGLDHEHNGLYSHCIFGDVGPTGQDPEYFKTIMKLRQQYKSTKYDTGSVMDVLWR
jgi:hypothetical protein